MSQVRNWVLGSLVIALLFVFDADPTGAQAARFSSLYTNLKTQCASTVKLKKGEEPQGDDIPLKCRGYGGYEVRIDYSAASSHLRLQPLRANSDDSINLATQPVGYDQNHKIEWRLANGKPFAVIYRIDKSKSDQPEEMWSPENKSGEALVIKGLKGFKQIDFEIDAKSPDANLKAREMADQAYTKKG